jgi:transketolase
MRSTFIRTLTNLADTCPDIVLMTGDLGYTVIEQFSTKHPYRFFNVGVAEQNMVGISTGLADSGFIPFLYSIVPFITLRPLEFIRNGPVYHNLPVRLIGVGGGFEYGHGGWTHFGLEDIGVMRSMPGMTIVAPADYLQAQEALMLTWDLPGPVYYRLGKDEKRTVPRLDARFELGRVQIVKEGGDVVLFTMGNLAIEAVRAADLLLEKGIKCCVAVVACISPTPVEDIVDILSSCRLAFTVEAHYLTGGLGSLVSEVIAENGLNCRLKKCGVASLPNGINGNEDFLNRQYHLTSDELVVAILSFLDSR